MLSHRLSAVLTSAIGAAAIGVTALAASATAGAGTADDTFIAQMKAIGVTFDSPQAAVSTGHQVCKELAAGESGTQIARETPQANQPDHQAGGGLRRQRNHRLLPAIRESELA